MGALNDPPSPPAAVPPSSGDHRQWKRILATLVEMVQSKQSEIDALAASRSALTDSLQVHRATAAARIALLKSHISQMKKEEEMVRRVHASKLNLVVGAKERETLLYKEQLELAESDRADFHVCIETLGAEILELKEKLNKGDTGIDDLKKKEKHIEDLEKEIRKTKHEHKKLISKKDSNISALVAEKDLIWKQFKMKDDEYTDLVRMKQMEDKRASETIEMMQRSLEVLQLEADKKDETIASLTADRAMLESDVGRLSQEAELTKQRVEELQSLEKEKDETIKMLQHSLKVLQLAADKKDETIAKLVPEGPMLELDVGRLSQEAERMKQRIEELQSLEKEKDARIARLRGELSSFDTNLTRCTTRKLRFSENSDSESGPRNVSGALEEAAEKKIWETKHEKRGRFS